MRRSIASLISQSRTISLTSTCWSRTAPELLRGLTIASEALEQNFARTSNADTTAPTTRCRAGRQTAASQRPLSPLPHQSRGFSADVLRHKPKHHQHKPKPTPVKVIPSRHPEQGAAEETQILPEPSRASSSEVAGVVGHEALVITRNIEWGNVIFGFEQANKYTILNEQGETVALLAEELGGIGRTIGRQLLRTRRPMTATVLSPDGSQVIFRVRRSFYLINSSIYVEDGTGRVIGEVKQRWHLWQRNYELFMGKRQFAAINGGLMAWEFVLKDEQDGVLALIDRNFQGFGKEIFTDAGKYVIHFGSSAQDAAQQTSNTIAASHPDRPPPPVTALAKLRTGVAVVPTQTGTQLEVARQLILSERMLALAAAVSIDFDYFSRHSSGGGGMMPFFLPIPMPSPPYPEGGDAGAAPEATPEGGEAGEGSAGSAGAADFPDNSSTDPDFGSPDQPDVPPEPLERDLGDDPFGGDFGDAGGGWEDQQGGDDAGFGDSGMDDADSGGGGLWDTLSDLLRGDD